ncbi:MAG: ABC transporter ATP-binding protein [Cyanobacteria bacterium K_Offshore_surface_m2_239]|nr:ABC transporter ATP-binding protein [Cyanobacteria bacterium K_Offshore_surface_m2_239]
MKGLHLDGVCRQAGGRPLLENLELRVAEGECVALLGPSGCGKTTTLRVVAGLDPLSAGRVLLDGEDISGVDPALRRVGMVFQSYALYPHLSVADNLTLGLKIRGVPAAEREERLSRVLSLLRLQDLRPRRPAQLSGGQRQRVALGRALLRQPRIMLLDEPMSNLDAQLREELRPELRALLSGAGHPVLYVTHDQQEAMGLADRIAVLDQGRLQQVGDPRELHHNPANRFVASFLGRPAINLFPPLEGRQLAVRPEHLRVVSGGGLPARVVRAEWNGPQQVLWLDTAAGLLRLLWPASSAPPDTLRVDWDPEHTLAFEASGGDRLPRPDPAWNGDLIRFLQH